MRFRWTMKELAETSDTKILRSLVVERQTDCSNMYSPLYKRLQQIYNRLDKRLIQETLKEAQKFRAKRN